jgi:glycosyltransferase involved in cell wall biosynthesis
MDENVYVLYLSSDNLNKTVMGNIIEDFADSDLYIHGIYSYWFSIVPLQLGKKICRGRIIVAVHGMLGEHAIKVKSLKKNLFLNYAKFTSLYKNVYFHAANMEEAKGIERTLGRSDRILVAGELPMNQELKPPKPIEKEKSIIRFIYLARISQEKNLKFALEALRQVRGCKVIYDIYGPIYDKSYWASCQEIIGNMAANIEVSYKGSLKTDEVPDVLSEYHFLFLPTTGENFGHTILESLQNGRPVLISDKTPWRRLQTRKAGFDVSLQNPHFYLDKIKTIKDMDQKEYDEYSDGAFRLAKEFIVNPSAVRENKRLFNNA